MSLSINGNYDETAGEWCFKLIGEVDISNAHQLKKQLETAYGEHASDIAVDVSSLSYIDSTGLGVIIGVYGNMKESGHRIRLLEPRENIRKLLRITSLDKVLC